MCRVLVMLLALGIAPASAHHGSDLHYDMNQIVTVEGEIVELAWRNPHVMFEMRRTDDGGLGEVWEMESASVNSLLRIGVDQSDFAVGQHVKITGALSRHGLPSVAAYVLEDATGVEKPIWPRRAMMLGREVQPAPISAAAADAGRATAESIFRVWARPDLRGLFLEDGYLPFTEAAIAARESWDPLEDDPVLQCEPRGMPSLMNNPLPVEFIDQGEVILMRLEEWDVERPIHLIDGSEAASQPPSPIGYSVGRWEGRTLVVTTTGISDPYFDDMGTPQGEGAVITERFTLSEDETRLDYESIHDDPVTFTEPGRQSSHWDWVPGEQVRTFDCVLD